MLHALIGRNRGTTVARLEAEDRRQVVLANARPALLVFFPVVATVGVMEWLTRPGHRSAVLIVGTLYVAIASLSIAALRLRPQAAVAIAVGGVSALCAAMLGYSPMVRGGAELCVLAITVLLGGFALAFPLGLRNQLLASIVPLAGFAIVLQLGTQSAYPVWYSASSLVAFLFVVAVGARSADQHRARLLQDAFLQGELAAENARLRDEAQAADRAKSDLVSILSHELRTPLHNVHLLAQVLIEGALDDAAERKEMLRVISDQSQCANDLVNTMLAFGSIETGGLRTVIEEFDAAQMIERIRAGIPPSWCPAGVAIAWPTMAPGVRLRTDRSKFEAIVRNLLHNALKHTTSGSVTLAVEADPVRGAVSIAVTDTGEGIPSAAVPHIFDRFARATQDGTGFGLGLYIVKRFTEALGGEVRVESAPGSGSCFEVVLPAAIAASATAPRAA